MAGLTYLRWSVVADLVLFPAFLLAPWAWLKFALLALLGLFNAGWYPVLKAQLYSAMPGQSGTVMAVDSLFGLVGGLLPLGLGFVAQYCGLRVTMWLLLAGPVVLLAGIPRRRGGGRPAEGAPSPQETPVAGECQHGRGALRADGDGQGHGERTPRP